MVSVNVAEFVLTVFTTVVPKLKLFADTFRAEPVPLKETICGLPKSESLIDRVSWRGPALVGVSTTLIRQVEVAGIVAPQVVLLTAKSGLLKLKPVRVIGVLPKLLIVSVWATLVLPTAMGVR